MYGGGGKIDLTKWVIEQANKIRFQDPSKQKGTLNGEISKVIESTQQFWLHIEYMLKNRRIEKILKMTRFKWGVIFKYADSPLN